MSLGMAPIGGDGQQGRRWAWGIIALAAALGFGCGTVHEHPPDASTPPPDGTQIDAGPLDAPPADVTLTITKSGEGTGTIRSAPAGIDCGATCTFTAPAGTVVTLTAMPGTDTGFAGWTGGGCAGMDACEITLDEDVTIDARFEINAFAVTVAPIGNGTGTVTSSPAGIDCGSDCTETFPVGTVVTLTAAPAAGSTFLGWAGGSCTGTAPCTLTVSEAASIQATFAMNNALVVGKAGNGAGTVTSSPAGISCGADCSEAYPPGTAVTLTATPATGSVFGGWSGGGCSGTSSSCTVTVSAAVMVTATFTLIRHRLTVTKSGSGGGTVSSNPAGVSCGSDCTEDYNYGTTVTLTATPVSGSVFSGWSGACSGTGTCTVSMTQARSVNAAFTAQHVLTVTKTGGGAGTVTSNPAGISCGSTCSRAFNSGTSVTLTASATTGSLFTGWSGACSGTSTTCTVSMTAARSVTASFIPRGVLYTIRQTDNMLRRLNPLTGQFTDVGALGVNYTYGDCAWHDAQNTLYMVPYATNALYRVNPITGAATLVGNHGRANATALAYHYPSGQLYMVAGTSLYRVSATNGAATLVGSTGVELDGLAWDHNRQRMVGLRASLAGGALYTVNLSTGATTQLASAGAINNNGLTWDPIIDRHWAADTNGALYQYNPASAMARTTVGTGTGNHTCITFRRNLIP